MSEKRALIYLVWKEGDDPETDEGYWSQYTSLEDAASDCPGGEVFTARPRLLGKFRMERKPIRIRPRKRKK